MTTFFMLTGLAILMLCLWFTYKNLSRVWLIQRVETSAIGDIKRGLVEIKGQVSALSEGLVSPYGKVSCVYYRFHVREKQGSGKHSRWVTVLDLIDYATCLIEDDTGACEVDLSEAELMLATDTHESSGFMSNPSPELAELLEKHGITTVGVVFNKTMKYQETVLEVGDQIYVMGDVEPQASGFPLIRGSDRWFLVSDSGETALKATYLAYAAASGLGVAGSVGWIALCTQL